MNDSSGSETSYRSLLLLEEIAKEEPLSQRDLSKRVGIAVGLVNSYIKNMISRGYIRVASFPKNRYKYLLTPKGIAEKSRLTYQHLSYFTNLYTTARKDFRELFGRLEAGGIKKVVFCGVDEVAEIAYLSLQETGIELAGVVDDEAAGRKFFTCTVTTMERIKGLSFDKAIVTSFKKSAAVTEGLEKAGFHSGEYLCITKGA